MSKKPTYVHKSTCVFPIMRTFYFKSSNNDDGKPLKRKIPI